MNRVYMDANATTPLAPEVFAAMRPWFTEQFGNASSIHFYGQRARAAVERAREQVAHLLGCRPAEVVFTSGGTEGDNLALTGVLKPGDHLITSAIEHHAVLHTAARLGERGVEVTFLPVNTSGVVEPEEVRRALRPNTRLISVMMANNEIGTLQPVAEIGAIAQEADVYFHTDAVQAVGKLPIDVTAIGCDLLSISGHKFHGPQGTGALYVRRGTHPEPLIFGGPQEHQRRAGTENLPGIVGLGDAAERAQAFVASNGPARIAALRDRLEQGILARVSAAGKHGGDRPRVANTTNLWFDHLEGEALVIALDLKGLAISGGSACTSGAMDPSHVLRALGVPSARAGASLRFSLDTNASDADVDFALELVPAAVAHLRELSPFYNPTAQASANAAASGATAAAGTPQ
ncbi:MAG TPA: aminotransferase class V-fold PLP-dependent enzyme [Acidobacteriaceae bacterium]|nr:aminotransferase class V-fold PLP-dependent enzyme [Acidobacteriaceae bacterium]